MIAEWLSPRISSDLSLVSGFLTWIIILGWLWHSGWRVQRRYFIEVTQKPLSRNAIVWGAGIVGAVFFVAAQMRPGMPAVMTVAMIGALSAYVDACTHRLPNMYTVVMGIGVIVGTLIGCLISPMWPERLVDFAVGALIWLVPVAILNRLPGGMGGGDGSSRPCSGPWWLQSGCTPPSSRSPCPLYPRVWPPCGRSSWARPARSRGSPWARG